MADSQHVPNDNNGTPAAPPENTDKTAMGDLVTKAKGGDGAALADVIDGLSSGMETLTKSVGTLQENFEKAKQPQYPFGLPNGGSFGIISGESPNTSRPYSMLRLAKALASKGSGGSSLGIKDAGQYAKVELDLSERLQKAYYGSHGYGGVGSGVICPLSTAHMPTEEYTDEATGEAVEPVSKSLVEECRQVMRFNADPGEAAYMARIMKSAGYDPRQIQVMKDLSAQTATSGGTLVGLAAQGELIDLLRAVEVFSMVGADQIDFPPQGRIRFPRHTGAIAITAVSEGATLSESTPTTGALTLQAKPYTGLVDIPDELMRFSTSVSVEAWLRASFTKDLGLKTSRDMIDGPGGTSIQGVINYSGVNTVIASTTAANGDTLDPEDPLRLYAAIADSDAPVDGNDFCFILTNTLWVAHATRKASTSGEFMSHNTAGMIAGGGGQMQKVISGFKAIASSQVPTNRVKGASSDLTLLLGVIGSEWIIARAGVVEIEVTNSDSTKFQQRISTMRGTQYVDAGPRHEASHGFIDDITNS